MFKDYDKYLSTSLKVYIFVLVLVFILKLVGMDYFGLDINNPTMLKISKAISYNHIGDIYYFFTIYIQFYFYLCIVCKKRKLYLWALLGSCLNFAYQILIPEFGNKGWIYSIYSISIMIIIPIMVLMVQLGKWQVCFLTIYY